MGRLENGYFREDGKYFCEYCGKFKDVIDFAKDNGNPKGFKSKCKECYNEYIRNYNRLNK